MKAETLRKAVALLLALTLALTVFPAMTLATNDEEINLTADEISVTSGVQFTGAEGFAVAVANNPNFRTTTTSPSSISPSGNNVPISTNKLVIKFDEEVLGMSSVVTISGDAQIDPVNLPWESFMTEFTYDLSGLKYGTTYTVEIKGFRDENEQDLGDYTHTFTTRRRPSGDDDNNNNNFNPNIGNNNNDNNVSTNDTPAPTPENPVEEVTLTAEDLDRMLQDAVDGVMVLNIEGDIDNLLINLPLSWFLENIGVTLLVYNEGLGLMAVTSENMIKLASQIYDGEEGSVTIEINGEEYTFVLDTIISYNLIRGSIDLKVAANGRSMDWYIYDSPIILGIPFELTEDTEARQVVAYRATAGNKSILPRSVLRDGLEYLMISSEGRFDAMYNPVKFNDVYPGWTKNAIDFASSRGIMYGVGDDMFDPSGQVTRAQFISMLMRMLDYEVTEYDPMPFDDIDPDSWYYESVCKAAALGLTMGVGDGHFAPDALITRQDLFTMTYRAFLKFYVIIPELSETNTSSALAAFSDTDLISDYALEAMRELAVKKLVLGDNGKLKPLDITTRAEAAQLISNIIHFMVPDYREQLP